MNEDTRLFSSNNPIGRLWYFINIIILALLTVGVREGILNHVIPSANPSFEIPLKCILYLAYFIFAVTFFMLVDRRLCNIFITREDNGYNIISKILNTYISIIVVLLIFIGILHYRTMPVPPVLETVILVMVGIFAIFALIIGFIPELSDKHE